jgi:hypothetical protein
MAHGFEMGNKKDDKNKAKERKKERKKVRIRIMDEVDITYPLSLKKKRLKGFTF